MRPRRFAIALVVAFAFAAVTATGAFGAATTTVEPWRTGTTAGGTTVLSGSQAVTAGLTSGSVVFEALIGGVSEKVEATELACVSCSIANVSGGAKAEGRLELRHATATPCALSGTTILSNPLTMDWTYMIGATAYAEVAPTAGTSQPVFSFTLAGPCANTYKVVGNFFMQAANTTGVYATSQGVSFSKAINETAGGLLKIGANTGYLTGAAKFEAGGKFFGVE